jgi:hypothetical protein
VEQFASGVATLLLVATPVLVAAKLVHAFVTRRATLASRGSRGARVEPVAWLLLGALDSHTFALWSSFANQPEDLCASYRPDLGTDVHIDSGGFFDYPVTANCVWPQETVAVTPWVLNVLTALFLVSAAVVTVHTVLRARSDPARRPS